MNENFIQIKSLEGELKISHKKRDYGLTVSTKEFVLHKPHVNYIVKLENIISIVPFDIRSLAKIRLEHPQHSQVREIGSFASAGSQHYKILVTGGTMHNRSGIFQLGSMDFIIPIHERLLKTITQYAQLQSL
ncbi:hypothetical protein [Paenibacillus turpanensis]|uniref:hypothetical protein n=1 Tax=Paenibacillus turpanensis TaxID=2689078 RepID=UPI00140ABD00|nr:hypothetical protein [Paenibacillus turpanensis]